MYTIYFILPGLGSEPCKYKTTSINLMETLGYFSKLNLEVVNVAMDAE